MTLIYGHRGAKGEVPENTLASFQHCLNAGVSRCELDLHLSADGVPMVIHDETPYRTTKKSRKRISQLTAAALCNMDASHAGPAYSDSCPIPTLESLLISCHFEHWQLEIKGTKNDSLKAESMVICLKELLERLSMRHLVTITSFDVQVIKTAQLLYPEVSRGYISQKNGLKSLALAKAFQCEYLILNHKICSQSLINQAKQDNIKVSVWTLNQCEDMNKLANMGVHSIVTDFPSLAYQVIKARTPLIITQSTLERNL